MSHDPKRPLLSVAAAVDQLTGGVAPLPSEEVPLQGALGRVLAESLLAPHDLPPFANSAMDGFAVRAADVQAAADDSPVELHVVGQVAAGGEPPQAVSPGQAIRITTGAVVPAGADAVVPVEWTSEPGPMAGVELTDKVRIQRPVQAGTYVRPAGLDLQRGAQALSSGRMLRPQEIGLLAALGYASVRVHRRAKVAILSTGDEVVPVDDTLSPGEIRDSNGSMIAAFVEAIGGAPIRLGIAADDASDIRQHLDVALDQGADLILSTAGVSMGSHDFVRQVVEANGELSFWRVNIRPGKPLAHGSYQGVPFLGLPGNPVSSWVTFAVFAQPLIDRLHGRGRRQRLTVDAKLRTDVRSDGRESFLRAKIGHEDGQRWVELTGDQSSAILSSLVRADGLLHLPAGVESVEAGQVVGVWLMGQREMLYVDD